MILKGRKIAAHQLEAALEDIVFENGRFSVAGTDRSRAFEEICLSAYVPADFPLETLEPGLEEQAFYDPVNFSFPGGAHIAEVEIDPRDRRGAPGTYTRLDDVGTVINPMIVAGQLHGGIVQGVGQALCESAVYDEASGQLLSGSFMDYCMPRADMLPHMTTETHSTPCAHTRSWHQGLRRGRHHRLTRRRHQRDRECAVRPWDFPRRHAGDPQPGLAADAERQPDQSSRVAEAPI